MARLEAPRPGSAEADRNPERLRPQDDDSRSALFGLGAILGGVCGLSAHGQAPRLAASEESGQGAVRKEDEDGSTQSKDHNLGESASRDKAMSDAYSEPEKIHGLPPNTDPAEIRQHYPDTCAIRSQEIVLRDFGIVISEDQLRQEASEHGWYLPSGEGHSGGSPAGALGNLLELHGVKVNRYVNANIFNLQNELAQGHRVIIGVDSGELWDRGLGERLLDKLGFETPDHALVVSSIDTSEPEHVKVILTEPGTGQVAAVYTQEQFQDAWQDSNCQMVSTVDPAPPWASGMEHFDYAKGHVSPHRPDPIRTRPSIRRPF
jgi:hypothetical protein